MACVDLPALPLQLLLRRHPDWRQRPAAVVDADRPQGILLQVNERARGRGILPGMRYAAALSLSGELRAAEMPRSEIDAAIAALAERLRDLTPGVEPHPREPGVFWLDASGLERLHPSLREWAGLVRAGIERAGFCATVVVGFTRFGSYAVARASRGVVVFDDVAAERVAAHRVPLDRIGVEPAARDALARLGIANVEGFLALPVEGLERRFGAAALELHRTASGDLSLPLQPEHPAPPACVQEGLEPPETSVERLLFVLERQLGSVLALVEARNEAVAELHVGFGFERLGQHVERVRPAEPTLDARRLLELVSLRLHAVRKLPDRVLELLLAADGVPVVPRQRELSAARARRDLGAAARAVARVRAELGAHAVVRARLREGHLPEARFVWESADAVPAPRPRLRPRDGGTLVRRIYDPPVALPPRERHEPDGWMLYGLEQGPVVRVRGPYVVAGGWWRRAVQREYHFAETRRGELLWVYYDRPRRQWFLHGRVE